MKTTLFLISTLILLSYSVSAQKNHGFYGKTNFVEFTSVSYVPLIKNLYNNGHGYEKSGSSLITASPDWFNTGFRVSVGRAFQKSFGASFEYGMDFWSTPINTRDYFSNGTSIRIERHENLSMSTTHFMPKLHFASKSALLPLGLNHEFGIGYTQSKVKNKEYVYQLDPFGDVDPESSSEYIDFDRRYRGVQLLYCLKMRKPLSKSILLNYGLRYTLDFSLASSSPNLNSAKFYLMTNNEIGVSTRSNNFKNVLSFDFGLTYAF